MFYSESEYFEAAITNKESYVKPTVKCSVIFSAVVGERGSAKTIDHPAVYLNFYPYVSTSTVLSVAEDGRSFETMNTLYVLDEGISQ